MVLTVLERRLASARCWIRQFRWNTLDRSDSWMSARCCCRCVVSVNSCSRGWQRSWFASTVLIYWFSEKLIWFQIMTLQKLKNCSDFLENHSSALFEFLPVYCPKFRPQTPRKSRENPARTGSRFQRDHSQPARACKQIQINNQINKTPISWKTL